MADRIAREAIGWVGWFILVFAAASLGSIASIDASEFYTQLAQPAWAPPPWLFGPVWTTLYLLMAVSVALVWRIGGFVERGVEIRLFVLQLALNSLWSWLFFQWHLGGLAFAEVILLWLVILVTSILFCRVRPLAGLLLIPYLLWVTFAAALNFTLWQLNPQFL